VEYRIIAAGDLFQQIAQYYGKRENQMVFVILRHWNCDNFDFYA
jgi:hypothetical protein